MLGVIDSIINKCYEKSEKGRVSTDDIPLELFELGSMVLKDMAEERYGNHFPADVSASMPFLRRFASGEGYEDGMPLLYLDAFKKVAQEWSERCYECTEKLPVEQRDDIKGIVDALYDKI